MVAKSKNQTALKGALGRKSSAEVAQDLSTPVRSGLPTIALLGVFVALFSVISITSFVKKSPTVDEPIHLLSGYASLKWADYRSNPEHPPLAKLWAALPLLAMDIKDPRPSNLEWSLIAQTGPHTTHTGSVAAKMIFIDNDAEKLFFWAKLQIVVLAILLGVFVYRWSRELFGVEAAIIALFIYCLDPNILAHSQIVHTDMAFTALFFIGSYYFWRTLEKLTWPNLALSAGFFGLAATTKYAYVAMFAVWGTLGIIRVFTSRPQELALGRVRIVSSRREKAMLLAGILLCSLLTAYLLIWCTYGWRFDALTDGGQRLPMAEELSTLPHLRGLVSFLTRYRLVPEAWIYGQLFVLNNLHREAYLFGSYSQQGFWLYFPTAFAVKTPVPTLLLLLSSVVFLIVNQQARRKTIGLYVPILVYFSLAILSRISIGVRHILPVYPFLFVLIAITGAHFWRAGRRYMRWGMISLGLWWLWSTITIYPHFLAYFNELAGGPRNGHKVLLDSNLDWGQDLKGLKRWITDNGVGKIQFLYFGFHNVAAPRYYGIEARYLPGSWVSPEALSSGVADASPDYLAISANHLFGRHYVRGERRVDFLKPFLTLSPTAMIGYSIYVFRMSQAIEELRRSVEMNPSSAQAHADLGGLLENQGMVIEAEEHYRRAVQSDEAPTKALYGLGMILAKQGKTDEAVDLLQRASEASPRDEDIHYDLGLTLALRGDLDRAITELRRTIQINPLYTKAYYNVAMLLAKKGQSDDAIGALRAALKANPVFAMAHYQLGLMLARQGDLDDAVLSYRQALRAEPGMVEAHENLGRALVLLGRSEEGIKQLEEAVRLMKSRPAAQAGQ